jgi:hypothetical protein
MTEARRPDLQLHALLLCDYAMTAQDGKISAIGIFSQITVSRLPAVHGRLFVVAIMEAAAGRHELAMQVISPSGESLLADPPRLTIDVPSTATTANVVADLNGLEVRTLGQHRIDLRCGERLLGSVPFTVNLLWQPGQAGNA